MSQRFIPTVQAGTKIYVALAILMPGDRSQVTFFPKQTNRTRPVPAPNVREAGIFLSAKRYDDVKGY